MTDNQKPENPPAFPHHGSADHHLVPVKYDDPRNGILQGGMTLRDYFAAKALQTLITDDTHPQYYMANCEHAYSIADCMLVARQQ